MLLIVSVLPCKELINRSAGGKELRSREQASVSQALGEGFWWAFQVGRFWFPGGLGARGRGAKQRRRHRVTSLPGASGE